MSAPWEKYQQQPAGQAPATSAPMPQRSFPGVIQGAPDPAKQAAEARAADAAMRDERRLNLTERNASTAEQLAQIKIEEANDKALERQKLQRAQETGIQDSLAQMRRVVDAAKQAKELSNSFFATGFGSSVAQSVGGTKATDVAALLNTIGSNTAFDRLQRMREESKTGGALGAVSEIELRLLRDSIASLDQSQSDEQFRANMDKVIEAYSTVISRLEGGDNARQPTEQDIYANGVRFGDEPNPDGFDRQEVLRAAGWPEGGEAMLLGFNRANNGNEAITAADVQRFYDANGLPYPEGYDFEFAADSLRRGEGATSAIDTSADRSEYDAAVAAEADRMDQVYGESGAMDLAKSGLTLGLLDESTGVGTAIGRALTGDFNLADNYALGRDAERVRLDRARERTGAAGTVAEVIGGGGLGRARALAGGAGGLVAPTTVRQAGREGAMAGAVGGFGYGEGAGGSGVNALVGLGLGGALGAGGQAIGNALAQRAAGRAAGRSQAEAQAIADAGQAEGITVNRAMLDPQSNNAVTNADATLIGGRIVQREMGNIEGQLADRVSALGGNGRASTPDDLGSIAQSAVNRTRDQARTKAGRMFEKADELAGGKVIKPSNAIAEIDQNIAELTASGKRSNASLIKYLNDVKQDLANGITVRGLRDQRTSIRGQINERNLGMSDAERRMNNVIKAAAQDIEDGLQDTPQALKLYKRADAEWREMAQFRKNVMEDILGPNNKPKSSADAAAKLNQWMRKDAGRFEKFWSTLSKDERADFAADIATRLGSNAKGEFSPALFLNNIPGAKNPIISERALRTVFGAEGAESVKNLKRLATEVNRVTSAMNSRTSKSAIGMGNYKDWLLAILPGVGGTLGSGVGAGALASGSIAAGMAGKQFFSAKALMSPKVQKWLLNAPKTANPKAIDAHFKQLGQIAKAQPALAGDLQLLERAMLKAANDNSGRTSLVAEDSQQQIPQE